MEKQVVETIGSNDGLIGQRVEVSITTDKPLKVGGYVMKRIPSHPYLTDANSSGKLVRDAYGVILDHPILVNGTFVQILVLARLKCTARPEVEPFKELWLKSIYVQVYATSRYSSLESLWLFDQILSSPQETLEEHFDIWYPGRVVLSSSVA